jgi:hypothetical protein
MHPVSDTPRWVGIVLRVVAWAILGIAGLAAALTAGWFLLVIISLVGYKLGFWGPPFGGE